MSYYHKFTNKQQNHKNDRSYRSKRDKNLFKPDDNTINNIIDKINRLYELNDMTAKEYADLGGYADKIAKRFSMQEKDKYNINSNQLRKIFVDIKNIDRINNGNWDTIELEFSLLKPKLAISVSRKLIPKKFYDVIILCMNKVNIGKDNLRKINNFNVFVNFFESIIAYHKYYSYIKEISNNKSKSDWKLVDNIINEIRNMDTLKQINTNDIYIDYSENIAKDFRIKNKNNMVINSNQLRKIFNSIRNIEQNNNNWDDIELELDLLKPKIAYSVGRELIPKKFYEIILLCIDKINVGTEEEKVKNFEIFVLFFESVIAFYTYYENI